MFSHSCENTLSVVEFFSARNKQKRTNKALCEETRHCVQAANMKRIISGITFCNAETICNAKIVFVSTSSLLCGSKSKKSLVMKTIPLKVKESFVFQDFWVLFYNSICVYCSEHVETLAFFVSGSNRSSSSSQLVLELILQEMFSAATIFAAINFQRSSSFVKAGLLVGPSLHLWNYIVG